jgi:hypothetical protein
MGRQQLAGHRQRFLHIFQFFYLDAQQGVDHRQVIGGIGKPTLVSAL